MVRGVPAAQFLSTNPLMSKLIDTTKFPYAPDEAKLRPLLERRQDLLSRLHRAYMAHNAEVDEQDEMWNGLVNGASEEVDAVAAPALHVRRARRPETD